MSVYYDKGKRFMTDILQIDIICVLFICHQTQAAVMHYCDWSSSDGGDMDARDYVRMRSERRLREGLEGLPGRQQKIGSFERFTKVWIFL